MKTLIQQARVLCPKNNRDEIADIAIAEGKIVGYGASGEGVAGFSADDTVSAKSQWLIPGLVDIATKLREPGSTQAATIDSEAKAAVKNGITTVVCQPDTDPVIDEPSVVRYINRSAKEAQAARVECLAALTKGNKGQHLAELAALKEAGCIGATNAGQPIENSLVLRRAMQYAASFKLPIIMNPFDAWLTPKVGGHEGELTTRMGLSPISVAAETAALLRDIAIAEDLGVSLHVGRISSRASMKWIEMAKSRDLPITCDTAIHHLMLSDIDTEGFGVQTNVMPPLRDHADREGLIKALKQGHIDVLTSDHQPLHSDDKDGPFGETVPGISGLDTLLGLVLHLVSRDQMPLLDVLAKVTVNPAKILGLEAGTLEVGAPADIVIYQPDIPTEVDISQFQSQGKTSPFNGWWFGGYVQQTWVAGRSVYQRG
jgi:dihydroorotase